MWVVFFCIFGREEGKRKQEGPQLTRSLGNVNHKIRIADEKQWLLTSFIWAEMHQLNNIIYNSSFGAMEEKSMEVIITSE